MTTYRIALFAVIALATSASAQPDTLATARADAERGEYRTALQRIGRLLTSSTEPSPADRFELLMLKAECQLQLKDRIGAARAFTSAGRAATGVEQLASARANALIVDRSQNGAYRPVGEAPIDIMSPETRKQAMSRLLELTWSKHRREAEEAMRADALPPIERVFTEVADAHALELATTGEGKETGQVMKELGGRAFGLMRDEVSRYAREVDRLGQLANSAQAYGGWDISARGLLPAERDKLRDMNTYMARVRGRAREYRAIAARLGGDQQKWDSLVAEATDALFEGEALASRQPG